ncbi:MAG: glycerophosphodiester phosphodiesterase [Bacteriovoracaceae bacterium]|nr:glycerophosphodiester phosphodiesterase [Bacteriovoracaceae bacterium]
MKFLLQCTAITLFISCMPTKKKVVIAHRSASGYLPEHTLEATAMAHSWDVDFIEPDIVMTKDNELVILHDHHLDTTTNVAEIYPERMREDGRYYAIDFKLQELKKLSVNERIDLRTKKPIFPGRFELTKSSFQIPTLREFIELVQGLNKTTGRNVGIYPEIKKPEFHLKHGKDITKHTIETLREYGYEDSGQIYIQSFWPSTLIRLKKEFKTKIPLVQLIASDDWGESSADYSEMLTDNGLKKIATYAKGIGPWSHQLFSINNKNLEPNNLVEKAHSYGLVVHPYTHRLDSLPDGVTNKQFLDFMFEELEVDGIFSDFADRVLDYLD